MKEFFKQAALRIFPFGTGFIGFVIAYFLHFPLPALMGPMFINAAGGLSGWPVRISPKLLPPIFMIIGWYLGGKVTPDVIQKLPQWWLPTLLILLWTVISTLLGGCYFRLVANYDRKSAIFASLPGALASIVAFIGTSGLEQKRIIIAQTVRVFFVVGALPLLLSFFLFEGDLLIGTSAPIGLNDFPFLIWLFCLILTLILSFFLRLLRVPSGEFLAATIISGSFYASGLLTQPLPSLVILVAFYVLGCIIGGRFTGTSWKEMIFWGKHAMVVSIFLIAFSIPGAFLTSLFVDINLLSLMLAYVPGGIHEMTIIAIVYDLNPLFVATMHFIRIAFIIFSLPLLFRIIPDVRADS